jgi:hypothetical protein
MSSLYRLRISINDDMSISLNVVRNAAVFCDSFNRSAMQSHLTRFSFREGPLAAAKVVSAKGDVDCLLSSFGAGAGLLVSFTSALLLPWLVSAVAVAVAVNPVWESQPLA